MAKFMQKLLLSMQYETAVVLPSQQERGKWVLEVGPGQVPGNQAAHLSAALPSWEE